MANAAKGWEFILMNSPTSEATRIAALETGVVATEIQGSMTTPARPFAFRFVVRFGPQLSTPCSRSLEVGPQTCPANPTPSVSRFQRHLRCHTFAR